MEYRRESSPDGPSRMPGVWRTVAGLLLVGAVSAMGGSDSPGGVPAWKKRLLTQGDGWTRTPQHLVFNNEADPETLDPQLSTGVPALRIVDELFEGLTALDPQTLEPRPGVAESWDVSDGGRRYVFHLRADARWSDGRIVVATDFVDAWARALDPKTACPYVNLLQVLENSEAYAKGSNTDFKAVGVCAKGPNVLEVRLGHPCAYFLDLMAFAPFFPLRRDVMDAQGDAWTRPGKLVSNGPFLLSEFAPRQKVVLARNPYYWDRGIVKLEKITALSLDDANTAYQMYMKGDIHWLPGIPQARVEEVRRNPDYQVTPYFGTYFYRFNVTRPPFDDPRVRRAFSQATDRREITDHVLKSGQTPVSSLCPPVSGYEPVEGLRYDPAQARALLKEAGYEAGKRDFPPVEIVFNTSEAHKVVAEAVGQQWKRNLGVQVALRNLEWKIFLNDMQNLNYQVCRSSWIGDYGDPSTFFSIFVSGDGNNRTGWSNPKYDALFASAQKEVDPVSRYRMFQEMESLLVAEDCPILPVYRYVNQAMLREAVRGWYPNIRDLHDLKYVWLEE